MASLQQSCGAIVAQSAFRSLGSGMRDESLALLKPRTTCSTLPIVMFLLFEGPDLYSMVPVQGLHHINELARVQLHRIITMSPTLNLFPASYTK